MGNFINISDIDQKDLRKIIDDAKLQKLKRSKIYKPCKLSKNLCGPFYNLNKHF